MKPGIEVPNMAKMSDLLNDIHDGVRSFDFSKCVDFDWDVPLCLDSFFPNGDESGETLGLYGAGLLKTVCHRTFTEPMPALYARSCWLTHWTVSGMSWLDDKSNPSPMISLAYTDRGLWHNSMVMGSGGRGLELGVGGTLTIFGRRTVGIAGEFHVGGRSEFIECAREGFYAFGPRNFSIGGRTSFERNGLLAPAAIPGLSLEVDQGARCGHGSIMDVAFEHKWDAGHVGMKLRGLAGMHIGANRHCFAGMDAECDDTCWYASVVYEQPAVMRRVGQRNRWIGRRHVLAGPWYNRQLQDEPEEAFDLRVQPDGSGT